MKEGEETEEKKGEKLRDILRKGGRVEEGKERVAKEGQGRIKNRIEY